MFIVECRVVIKIWRGYPIPLKHVSSCCLIFDPHQTTYQSNTEVPLRKIFKPLKTRLRYSSLGFLLHLSPLSLPSVLRHQIKIIATNKQTSRQTDRQTPNRSLRLEQAPLKVNTRRHYLLTASPSAFLSFSPPYETPLLSPLLSSPPQWRDQF